MEKILWAKEYHEDLGTKDEKGWYDYAYRYYIYWFSLPDKQKVKVRRYTDTPDHCSIFLPVDDLGGKKALEKSNSKKICFWGYSFSFKKRRTEDN